MDKRFELAGHIVELKAPESSPVWAACSKYAPFETCSQEFPVCSLEFAELKCTTKGELVYDVKEKEYPRLCFYRNGDVWTIEMAPESSLPIVAVMEVSLGFEKARIKMLETAPKTLLFALDNALMLLFAMSTAALDTLEIHSSVTMCDGKGYAFLGKSGTGKSKLARQIHNSSNPKAPFVEVVCNAIAPSLIESELFGYAPRAFTGADPGGRIGYFEKANGGTIFLDEIGEIPLEIQVKLLHVLQNKRIYRVGSTTPVDVDVRVITATNRDLEEEVKQGRFRQDLYYRINVFPIHIPALRERKRDLYILANSVLEDLCRKYDMEMKQFSEEALDVISGYDWPGNVRELENIIERAITVCDGRIVYSENLMIRPEARVNSTLKERLEADERKIIEDTLFKNNDDRKKTMDELGLSRTVFYEKLKKYEISK